MSDPAGNPPTRIDFGRVAEDYDATRGVPAALMQQIVEDLIATAKLDQNALVLEVGCGTGRFLRELAQQRIRMVGIDISHRMLDVARKSLQELSYTQPSLVIADAVSLPFPNGLFDAVLGVHVFHLLPDWQEGLQATKQALHPGGTLIIGALPAPMHNSRLYALYNRRRAELNYPAQVFGGTEEEVSAYLRSMDATIQSHEFHAEATVPLRETLDCLQRRLFSGMWYNMPDVIHRKLMTELRTFASSQFREPDAEERVELKARIHYARFG
jgi:ubiquinone/menaquinone biosynthesis C-methylase UbiE